MSDATRVLQSPVEAIVELFRRVRDLELRRSGGAAGPIGSIVIWPGPSSPQGYIRCDGRSLLRTSYPALFAAIGTLYGAADATHFNIPDFRNRFAIGASAAPLGESGGANSVTLTEAQIPGHTHTLPDHVHPDNHNHDLGNQTSGDQLVGRGASGTGSSELTTSGTRSVTALSQTRTRTGNTGNPTSNPQTGSRGGGDSHENRPAYVAIHYIIRAQ